MARNKDEVERCVLGALYACETALVANDRDVADEVTTALLLAKARIEEAQAANENTGTTH